MNARGQKERDALRTNVRVRSVSTSNVDRASSYIRHIILDGTLKPGMSVSDTFICKRLGISRTPIREALRRLELEGLILHVPHRGWAVQTLEVADIVEIFEIKECFESVMVRQAATNLTRGTKAKLISAVAKMEEAAKSEDRDAFVTADDMFHSTLYHAARNDRIKQILSSVNAQWRWIRVGYIGLLGTMTQAVDEHRAVLECLLAGDHDGAVSATVRNVFRVKQNLLCILNNLAMPFVTTLERRSTPYAPKRPRAYRHPRKER